LIQKLSFGLTPWRYLCTPNQNDFPPTNSREENRLAKVGAEAVTTNFAAFRQTQNRFAQQNFWGANVLRGDLKYSLGPNPGVMSNIPPQTN